jgi:hypothetical protein
MTFLNQARRLSAELADFIADVAEQPLSFRGEDPLDHSRSNHRHLSMIEYLADHVPGIDLDFRCAAVDYIFERWKERLKAFHPYKQNGYRLYLYADMSPTVSVVAETPIGFPYNVKPRWIKTPREVLSRFASRSWGGQFSGGSAQLPKRILAAVEAMKGSISKPTAQRLGISVAELRRMIEANGLTREVNALRKVYRRSPARFETHQNLPRELRVYELCLPGKFD